MKTTLTLKSLAMFIGIIGVTLFVFSCAGQNNNNNNPNQGNVFQNCLNCSNIVNGQTFFNSQSTDISYGMNLNLSFIGSAMGSSPIVSYTGSVAAQGQLILTQAVGSQYGYYGQQYASCYMPAGTYTMSTIQAGQWNQAIVSGLVLQATGPANVIIQIPQAQVSAKSQYGQLWSEVAPTGRLFGNMVIQSINNMNCQIGTLIQ